MGAGGILRRIGIALGVDVDDKEAKKSVESLKAFAMKTLGAITVGVSLAKVSALADEFGAVNKIIKNATRELGNQTDIQNQILEAANLTRSSYADTAKTVSSLVQENKDLFGNVDEAVKFNNAATMLFKTAGKTDDQISGLMESINKSFAKGAVDSETISQLLEQSPEAVELLEKKLGTTKEKLEDLASDGKISLKDLKETFTDSSDEIEKRFLESGVSINDALKNIRNQWGLYVAQVWNGAGVSQHVGKLMVRAFNDFMAVLRKAQPSITRTLTSAMNWLTKIADWITRAGSFLGRLTSHIGGVENAVKLLLIVAGAIWLAFNFDKIINGFVGVGRAIKGVFNPKNLKVMAIVALITLIALAVEDFINFLKGNDSVIGLIFDKLGIGADNARNSIFSAFGKIKDFLQAHSAEIRAMFSACWDAVLQIVNIAVRLIGAVLKVLAVIAMTIFRGLSAFWSEWGAEILGIFSETFEVAILVITKFAELISALFSGDVSGAFRILMEILVTLGVYFQHVFDLILSIALSILSKIVDGVKQKGGEIRDRLKESLDKGIAYIKSLPGEALKWGADMVDGIANGIRGAVGKVTDAAKGVADKIRSFLHFSRPDIGPLADYETWMPDFVDGLSRTLKGSKGKLFRAAVDVSQALDVRPNLQTTANAAGTIRNGNTVNQRVEINNTVHTTDAKAGKAAAKQMDKSSTDVTKKIADGLNYGRL